MKVKVWKLLAVLGAVGFGAVGCVDSGIDPQSVKHISEETIRSKLSAELGLGGLSAKCPQVTSPQLGAKFLCVATTNDDRVVNIEATVRTDGRVQIQTTNVIRTEILDQFETRAVQNLNGATGARLVDQDLECGDELVVLTVERQMVCGVKNSGSVHDITFTVSDVDLQEFGLEVARIPRP